MSIYLDIPSSRNGRGITHFVVQRIIRVAYCKYTHSFYEKKGGNQNELRVR
jgi:hypothetical protein